MMFLGTYEPKLDDKGRVILPAQEFEQMTVELRRAPLSSKQARDYVRVLLSGAYKEVPDKQGRITLPPDLRKYAGLDRELTVIGAGSRAEIWNSQAWNDYLSIQEDVFSQTENEIIPGMF